MANREYKSDVFSMLLEDKRRALDLYNAMSGTSYDDPDMVEICTLEKGVSLTVKNDASFIVNMDATLNIYEHQSTYNPNMPIRELIYFVSIIKNMVDARYMYSRKLMKIPTPKFVVFYNGTEKRPEKEILRLSSAFENQTEEPQLELICTVYNINPGNHSELLMCCQTLRDYMRFVEYVRENLNYYGSNRDGYDKAVNRAIDRCIEEDVLKEFFECRREEVQKAMMFDFTYEKQMENAKKEWFNDGRELGHAEGMTEGMATGSKKTLAAMVVKKVQKQKTINQIADELELKIEELQPIYDAVMLAAPNYEEETIMQGLKTLQE